MTTHFPGVHQLVSTLRICRGKFGLVVVNVSWRSTEARSLEAIGTALEEILCGLAANGAAVFRVMHAEGVAILSCSPDARAIVGQICSGTHTRNLDLSVVIVDVEGSRSSARWLDRVLAIPGEPFSELDEPAVRYVGGKWIPILRNQ